EPLLHLMRSLQRKASDRGLLKQGSEFSASPAMSAPLRPSTAAPAKSMSATVGVGASSGTRSYDKPWLTTSSSKPGGMRKSSSGNVAASMADYSAFERQRHQQKQPRASLTQPDPFNSATAGNNYLWSAGEAASAAEAPTTATAVAEAEADILGSEFRLARGAPDANSGAADKDQGSSVGDTDAVLSARGSRHRSAMAARQAAREARMRQLAETSTTAAAAGKSTDSAIGSGADEDDFEADGVLLMEDADALAAEGVRVSRRSAGVGRAVATSRQRAGTGQPDGPEPQVRMTFCGRCFAMINSDEEAAAMAAVTSRTDSARDAGGVGGGVGGGFGFLPPSGDSSGEGDAFAADGREARADTLDDDLEPSPNTGRTNATMTEVTDIESASQVTGPRRPSWGGGTGRSGASKQKRSTREHRDSTGSASSNRGVPASRGGFDAVAGVASVDQPVSLGQGSRGGWGAAAAAAAEADLSDQETERDRHLQQDVRQY
uniref:RING-type domain-containing protein n=1 Tax=Macrostomum lignano TaxID=282301 RepID=A0A1I8GP62_9PLAT